MATRGPPPRSRMQRRRQWRFRKGDLRDPIQHRRGQPSTHGFEKKKKMERETIYMHLPTLLVEK